MIVNFSKYQGTGNDFIIVDLINDDWLEKEKLEQNVYQLCDRRFGIGADGLILVARSEDYDFRMIYYNSDGKESTMCGNGGRCATHFYYNYVDEKTEISFIAIDGPHKAIIENNQVSLQMMDVKDARSLDNAYELNTGSPHYVCQNEDNLTEEAFKARAKTIRYNENYKEEGININFYKEMDERLDVITYERGVEDITFSCGTGVTAVAIAHGLKHGLQGDQKIDIRTKGGNLSVKYYSGEDKFTNVWLTGPAEESFKGIVEL
jgi:diaminopimelate epimerase